jgi:hypothetical protein
MFYVHIILVQLVRPLMAEIPCDRILLSDNNLALWKIVGNTKFTIYVLQCLEPNRLI